MAQIFKKFSTLFFIAICMFYSSNTFSQQKIILSGKPIVEGIPFEVLPFVEGKDVTIKDLKFINDEVSLNYFNKGNQHFSLVLYFKFANELLVNYSDTCRNLTLPSSGRVLFGLYGYDQTGLNKNGQIKNSINKKTYGVYDFTGLKGKLYAFVVKGQVYSNSILPGEQTDKKTFKAFSNVLSIPISF
jgi:hypothetical protein